MALRMVRPGGKGRLAATERAVDLVEPVLRGEALTRSVSHSSDSREAGMLGGVSRGHLGRCGCAADSAR